MKITNIFGVEKEISDGSVKYVTPVTKWNKIYQKIVFHNGDEIIATKVEESKNE